MQLCTLMVQPRSGCKGRSAWGNAGGCGGVVSGIQREAELPQQGMQEPLPPSCGSRVNGRLPRGYWGTFLWNPFIPGLSCLSFLLRTPSTSWTSPSVPNSLMSLLQSFLRHSISLHDTSASHHPALSPFRLKG